MCAVVHPVAGPARFGPRVHIKWLVVTLSCIAPLLAQNVKPNHINGDVVGESLHQYVGNNPFVRFSDPTPSEVQPRQTQRNTFRVFDTNHSDSNETEPDATYKTIPLKTMEATFLSEDGLVSLAFQIKPSDYDQLKMELLREFRVPDQVTSFQGETLTWDDGTSRIDLNRGEASENVSYLLLNQDEYFARLVIVSVQNSDLRATQTVESDGQYLLLHGSDGLSQLRVKVVDHEGILPNSHMP